MFHKFLLFQARRLRTRTFGDSHYAYDRPATPSKRLSGWRQGWKKRFGTKKPTGSRATEFQNPFIADPVGSNDDSCESHELFSAPPRIKREEKKREEEGKKMGYKPVTDTGMQDQILHAGPSSDQGGRSGSESKI